MKACIIKHKFTEELYKFTLGRLGEIIVTDSREHDLNELIVSLVPIKEVRHLNNDFYVVLQGEHE